MKSYAAHKYGLCQDKELVNANGQKAPLTHILVFRRAIHIQEALQI